MKTFDYLEHATPRVRELVAELRGLEREASGIAELSREEGRDVSPAELKRIEALNRKGELVEAKLDEIGGQPQVRKSEPTPLRRPHGVPDYDAMHAKPGKASLGWRDRETGEPIRLIGPGESLAASSGASYGERDVRFERMLEGLVRNDSTLSPSESKMLAAQGNIDSAGGYAVPTVLSNQIIDAARSASVAFQHCTILPMGSSDVRIVKVDTDPTAGWTGERVARSDDAPIFGSVTLRARTLRAFIPISEELLQDGVNVGSAISTALAGAFATAIDTAIIAGGATGDAIQPRGLRSLGTVKTASVGTPNFDDFSDAYFACLTANEVGPFYAIMHPRTATTLDQQKTSSTVEYFNRPESWENMTKLMSTAISITEGTNESYAIVCNLANVIVGIRQSLEIRISSDFDSGEKFSRSIVASMRMDIAIPRPTFVQLLTGITT